MKGDTKTPLWETLTLVAAFALLWAWIVERHLAALHHTVLDAGWKAAQGIAVVALIAILIIRTRRVSAALRAAGGAQRKDGVGSGQNGHPHK